MTVPRYILRVTVVISFNLSVRLFCHTFLNLFSGLMFSILNMKFGSG